ncbi:MAG: glycosyltransferase family 4 protein, partial [Planctomycetota bacterium]
LDVTVACGTLNRDIPDGACNVVETMRLAKLPVPYRAIGVERAWSWHDRKAARMLRTAAAQGRPFDVVHTWPSGALATLQAAREVGTASFLERPNCHTAFAYETVAEELDRLGMELPPGACHRVNNVRLALESDEFAAADRLLCPSDFVAETHIDRGVDPSKIARHRYGYEPGRFTPPVEKPHQFTAAFVGTCEPRKGLHLALDAWKRAGIDGTLLIVGGFVPGYREVLGDTLGDGVEHLGFVDDVPAVLRKADVLLLPSLEEGSALVTYEAQACGCVPMVSRAAGVVATDGLTALLHDPRDVATLSDQLKQLAGDTGRLRKMQTDAVAHAVSLTWADAARVLAERYTEALGAGRVAA